MIWLVRTLGSIEKQLIFDIHQIPGETEKRGNFQFDIILSTQAKLRATTSAL